MNLPIDHLAYATNDLEATVAELTERLGVAPAAGGSHDGMGSRNYLLSLGPACYLEIIGPDPDQPEPAQPRPFGIDDLDGPRLTGFAVTATGIESVVAGARERGYNPGDPFAMSRTTPNGDRLAWTLTLAGSGDPTFDGLVPFLIDWGDTPHPATVTPSGCTLRALHGYHPEVEKVRTALEALGVEISVARDDDAHLLAVIDTPNGPVELG